MTDRLDNTRDAGHRPGFSLVESVVVLLAVVLLVAMIQPSLASVGRQSKYSVCLDRLAVIAAATAIYSSEDSNDMALPVHPRYYDQDPSNPSFIGAYEWGGKSGIGKPGWVPGAGGSLFFLTSKYGTKAGVGPATRPLNNILYPHGFANNGPPEFDQIGAKADTQLELEAFRCPADDRPPGGANCLEWINHPERSAYDHFGTSYAVNSFWTTFVGGGPIYSNSAFLGPVSRVLDPVRTLAYDECIGRFAWQARRGNDGCASLIGDSGIDPGPTKAVLGWHGKNWTFNRAFVDGHVATQKVINEGTKDSNGYFEHYRTEIVFPDDPDQQALSTCIIIRGDGWQVDTLPADPVDTGLVWTGGRQEGECALRERSFRTIHAEP